MHIFYIWRVKNISTTHINFMPCHADQQKTSKNIFPLNLPPKKSYFKGNVHDIFPPVFSSARLSGGHHLWIPGDDDLRHAAPCRLIHLWVSQPDVPDWRTNDSWTGTKIQLFFFEIRNVIFSPNLHDFGFQLVSGVESGWQQGYRTHKSFILGVNHLHV